ncbi:hypothetical protein GTP44_00960 [Duganella sp. FT50W]|uniref:Uncharacterized protein n=1 Tax=Duganella lactea TaxID=2692173 RepID=A0A6L8ME53_9BURK|nr:hypothetical protein [Duganella lactea]MYM80529.1 hypothetical protein [Duganella lactea]
MKRLIIFLLLVACYLFSLLAPLRWLWALVTNLERAFEILKGYDLLGNPIFNGKAGAYISTRAYLAGLEGARWATSLSWMLDQIEPDHCRKSYESELARVDLMRQEVLKNGGRNN